MSLRYGARAGIGNSQKGNSVVARKVTQVIELTDDLDGGKADQTVAFSLNGASYEIDLSKKNANALGKALKPYVDNARKAKAARRRASAPPASSRGRSRSDLSTVRSWAKSNGYEVSDRGRIPSAVLDAYDAAN
jgi:nucleoid-associated protein Lsr2